MNDYFLSNHLKNFIHEHIKFYKITSMEDEPKIVNYHKNQYIIRHDFDVQTDSFLPHHLSTKVTLIISRIHVVCK